MSETRSLSLASLWSVKNPAAFGIWGLKSWGPDPLQGKAEGGKQAMFFLSFSGDKSQAFWRFQLATFVWGYPRKPKKRHFKV